ncbi:MAG TPA: efflux RND transporter periplasmic adaptor subunit [Longimicrobiaceae bacterium]|jgi:RND family efflux transporter MFP subunit
MSTHRRTARTPALVLLLAAAAACGDAGAEESPPPSPAVPVRTAAVVEAEVAQPVRGTGTLAAKEEVRLSFKTGGIVGRILVDEGDAVRAGQTLALLDPAEIDAHVARAGAAADKARRDLARARALYADSVATLEQMQDAAGGARAAEAELRIARFNREHARIVAPVSGTVLRRTAEEGETAAPGAPVLTLAGSGAGTVLRVGLADRDAVRVRRGDAATVRFGAFPGAELAGRVTETAAAADPRTGTYEVEVAVEPGGRALAAGLIGRVEIRPSRAERLRLVPVEAVLEGDEDRGVVYTLGADGRARRVPVGIAFLQGGRAAVRSGLDGVAEVVTDGAAYLEDGTPTRKVAP